MSEMGTKRKEHQATVVTPEAKRARSSFIEGEDGENAAPEMRDEGDAASPQGKDEPIESEPREKEKDASESKHDEQYLYVEKDEGDTFMGFGKYEAMTFRQVYTSNPGYYEWGKRVGFPSPQLKRFLDWVDASKEDDVAKTILIVGKHAGHSYSYVANHFPGYVDWVRALDAPCKELKEFIDWTKTQKTLVKLPAKNAT